MSWSRHGYENASYCSSQTGRRPAMQRPTAAPSMPASASGLSTHRPGPNRSRRPAVARKTPPARPTSSPSTSTVSSRASSTWSASFTASTRQSSRTVGLALAQLGELRRRVGVGVREEERRVRRGLGLRLGDRRPHRLLGRRAHARRALLVEEAETAQEGLVAPDALPPARLLHPLGVDVRARVVRRRVGSGAVVHCLEERGTAARPRALDRLPRRLVDGEDVEAVDANAGHPVPDRLVGERRGARLRSERRRDREAVVVADEHERRLHDGGEVRPLLERPLGRRAVAEDHHRDAGLPLQLLPPGEAGRVRHVRPHRHADRRDVPLERVPPAGRMSAPPLQDRRRRQAAHEPDRRLAVAREDPVLGGEREGGAGLDRLVVPGDRVRADPALTVVHDRPLVEHAEQDHAPVELEQRALVEPLGRGVAVEGRAQLPAHTSTRSAPRSAAKLASVTSPRSSPSACSASGRSQRTSRRGSESGVTRRGATKSSPAAKSASRRIANGAGPAYVYGRPFATKTQAARPCPSTSSCGSRRRPRSSSTRATVRAKTRLLARRPSALRPRRSTRRTATASTPRPQAKRKRRPFTRPAVTGRVRPAAIAAAIRAAAAAASRGRPSARGKTLAPPPGTKPSGGARSSPFTTSLYVPSPA